MFTVSTNGMDLLASPAASILLTDIVQVGALCLKAANWRGFPLCLHPLAQSLDRPYGGWFCIGV